MESKTIYHVEKDGKNYYFGSIAAIYSYFKPGQLGIQKESLWNYKISEDKPYQNKSCIIRKGVIIRQPKNAQDE